MIKGVLGGVLFEIRIIWIIFGVENISSRRLNSLSVLPAFMSLSSMLHIYDEAESLQDKVDAGDCSSPDEIRLFRRRKTVSTLHIETDQ